MKVYVLKDDKNNIRYVGITSGSLRSRLTKHIHDTNHRSKNNIPRNTLVKIINGESVNKYNEYKINKMICQ